jgi:DEAD/DEAH box helicase domain-containing protein
MRGASAISQQKNVSEYLQALKSSQKYGPQVVCHRSFPKEKGTYVPFPSSLNDTLVTSLRQQGIKNLYEHQRQAYKLIKTGNNVLVATPTSSGKSLIYNLPVLESIFTNRSTRALYLFPLKALAQDQLRVLRDFEPLFKTDATPDSEPLSAIYDGDTSPYQRQKLRKNPPNIIITNPDMLHLSFLPYHSNWAHFFKQLQYIIIDEVHIYRGVFGAHMSWVLRRLQRILALYNVEPVFILLSATIGNPKQFGEKLIGKPVMSLTKSSAPRSKRNMLFLNPWDSAAHAVSQMLEAALKRGLRTIVYTGSRKMAELITMWTKPRLGSLAPMLSSYRSGFLPEERRIIEKDLHSRKLLGVISTSALELGIDIGGLDICILAGYPGSIMATWQRGGRVGRGSQESAVILVAQEDALDQYFMQNHADFFARPIESAVLNPFNPEIMKQHLHCAAAEVSIDKREMESFPDAINKAVEQLTWRGVLLQGSDGKEWFATRKFPQRQVSLRGGGKQLHIIRQDNGEIIGEIDSGRALKECHPGAVYLHSSRTWLVDTCDLENSEVVVVPFEESYHTRPMSEKQTEILEVFEQKSYTGYGVSLGKLLVREKVTGYQKRNNRTNKLIATIPLDLPEQYLETVGLWLEIPEPDRNEMENAKLHFMGGIHALEHAMIGMFPLLVLCDRNDIGGLSCPVHHQTAGPVIFIYDGYSGGMGLCNDAFLRIEELLKQTRKTVESCGCNNGCPSCVHSPKCGSGNRPIDKTACIYLVNLLQKPGHGRFDKQGFKTVTVPDQIQIDTILAKENSRESPRICLPAHYGVFDLETKYSASDVGGWQNAHKMGISVAVIYDSLLDDFVIYYEQETEKLIEHLLKLDLVIGFNNRRFDNLVLSGYTDKNLNKMLILDLLEVVKNRLGYRLSLDRLARHTLGTKKTADGLQALEWYKQGEMEKISHYCKKDVAITRDLLFHGLDQGFFLFQNKAGKVVRLPVDLEMEIIKELKR